MYTCMYIRNMVKMLQVLGHYVFGDILSFISARMYFYCRIYFPIITDLAIIYGIK